MLARGVPAKWRPPLALVVGAVVATLLALPIVGLFAARTTSNQFIHETETSLHNQVAILAQAYANEYRRLQSASVIGGGGPKMPPAKPLSEELQRFYGNSLHPPKATLRMVEREILPPLPQPIQVKGSQHPVYELIGERLEVLALAAQKSTLAGYSFLDPEGRVISSTQSGTGSLAEMPEIREALAGHMVSRLRLRKGAPARYLAQSISRDTGYRVVVAHPVIVEDAVVGVVLAFRTPNNLRKFLLSESKAVAIFGGSVLIAAILVGYLLNRLLASPIDALRRQSMAITDGSKSALQPLDRYGTHEVAQLGGGLLTMSQRLQRRANSLEAYSAHMTHELKSPLTSIAGAVELMQDNGHTMTAQQRERFLENIASDANRMAHLLDDLRQFAASTVRESAGQCELLPLLNELKSTYAASLAIEWTLESEKPVPLDQADLTVLLVQLFNNAAEHSAARVYVQWQRAGREEYEGLSLRIEDDGHGIVEPQRVFEPFYTTKRDEGGTGMGLAIVKSMAEATGAQITASQSKTPPMGLGGARFDVLFGEPEK